MFLDKPANDNSMSCTAIRLKGHQFHYHLTIVNCFIYMEKTSNRIDSTGQGNLIRISYCKMMVEKLLRIDSLY